MYNNLTLDYLLSLVPSSVNEVSHYNLRNANDVQTINARTALYFNFPTVCYTRMVNIPDNDKYVDSVESFKRQISRNKTPVPKYFYTGSRKLQILHTRLRTGRSSLNYDLFVKSISETHCVLVEVVMLKTRNIFFFSYLVTFIVITESNFFRIVTQYCIASLHVFLHDDELLLCETNQVIYEAVYKYIQDSKKLLSICLVRPLVSYNQIKRSWCFMRSVYIYLRNV